MTVAAATTRSRTGAPDAVLAGAVDLAREVLVTIAEPGTVGDHLGMEPLEERLAMHWFACLSAGYQGWRWGVTVARVPRGKVATVSETNLLPGPDALLAPEWLPYADRLAPGDLGAGDVLPFREVDPYLEAGFEATGDEDVDQMGFFELGLGRPRVLSAEGREAAASRWYDGEGGPTSDVSAKATARCSSCGYFLPMAGALRSTFGVCANEWSPSDGRVISLDHGCGAHSETDADQPESLSIGEPIVDEFAVDLEAVEVREQPEVVAEAESEAQPEVAEVAEAEAEVVAEAAPEVQAEAESAVQAEAGSEAQPEADSEVPVEEQHGSDDPVTD